MVCTSVSERPRACKHELLSENIEHQFERKLTFGERLSDRIAESGGSWRFIILFGIILIGWIGLNVVASEVTLEAPK